MRQLLAIIPVLISFVSLHSQNISKNGTGLLYLGVVETQKGSWPNDNTVEGAKDTSVKKILRVLFYKDGQDWFTLDDKIGDEKKYPSGGKWYQAFDGKMKGSFDSEKTKIRFPDCEWAYPRDAYHSIVQKNLFSIGEPTTDFASWAHEKAIRPVIAVSQPNYQDPDKWTPFVPDNIMLDLLKPVYQSYIFKVYPELKTIEKPIMKIKKAYHAGNGISIIQVGMVNKSNQAYIDYTLWFCKTASGEIKNLSEIIDFSFSQDEFTDDDLSICTLVDAGDYDGDGRSEVLFFSSRYNGDGYVMFYNDFSKMSDFTWSYH